MTHNQPLEDQCAGSAPNRWGLSMGAGVGTGVGLGVGGVTLLLCLTAIDPR